MTKQILKGILGLLCISVLLAACKEKQEVVEVIRAIKTVTVKEQAAAMTYKFSGLVAAVDSSGLSFQVGGQVVSVEVEIGNRVKKGQLLAALDPEPFQLEVDEVEAMLTRARSDVGKSKAEYERQKRIFEQGAGAKRFVEVAEHELQSARSAVNLHMARLDQAKRDLRETKLLSPYNGTIAWRAVEPNEEVKTGQKILEINATGKMEVELAIPETNVDLLTIGDEGTIAFPTLPDESVKGRITDIGSAAVKANAFPVKMELIDPDKKIKPGMTAEASLKIKDKSRKPGYVIPVQAILPDSEKNQGIAFVYDPGTSTVKKTTVRYSGTKNKDLLVNEGLKAGDIIAVAGVSFLADGLKVKLMEQQ